METKTQNNEWVLKAFSSLYNFASQTVGPDLLPKKLYRFLKITMKVNSDNDYPHLTGIIEEALLAAENSTPTYSFTDYWYDELRMKIMKATK